MADKKIKGRDIAELIANNRGYLTKLSDGEFNKREWYGFKNKAEKILRIKYIYTPDAKENYNIYKNNIDEEKNIELLAVIKIGDSYHIVEIKSFNKEKISLNKSSFDSEFNDSEDINIILNAYINDSSIYKLSSINDTIYGISQRAENEKIDENAIKKLFYDENPTCSYCGITQKQINDLDAYVKENNQKYGLTIRARGRKLEVDQISPKDGNITLCCYWCNNAKTDTFSVKEFKEIARGINIAWNMKRKVAGLNDTICFPENSDIWG